MRDPNHTRTGINLHTTEGAEFRAQFRAFKDHEVVTFELDVGDDGLVIFLRTADIDRFKQAIFKSLLVADEAKELVGEKGGDIRQRVYSSDFH